MGDKPRFIGVCWQPAPDWCPVTAADSASINESQSKLLEVEKAITKYYLALDKREHAGHAEIIAFDEIQEVLGMSWQPEKALKELQSDKK